MDSTCKTIFSRWDQMMEDSESLLVENCAHISKYVIATEENVVKNIMILKNCYPCYFVPSALADSVLQDIILSSNKDELIESMKSSMKEICEINQAFSNQKKALIWCTDIEGTENINYEQEFDKKMSEVTSKKKKINVESDPIYKSFLEKVDAYSSNDMEVEEGDMNFLDPISKQTIKQPVKSQPCGHIFDKESIDAMFKKHCAHIRCPYVGCPHKLTKKDIIEDVRLNQQFERFLKTKS